MNGAQFGPSIETHRYLYENIYNSSGSGDAKEKTLTIKYIALHHFSWGRMDWASIYIYKFKRKENNWTRWKQQQQQWQFKELLPRAAREPNIRNESGSVNAIHIYVFIANWSTCIDSTRLDFQLASLYIRNLICVCFFFSFFHYWLIFCTRTRPQNQNHAESNRTKSRSCIMQFNEKKMYFCTP